MRFLVDENFPYPAVDRLRQRGHDAVAVRDIMRGATDEEVLARARLENRVLVTADKDFGEMIFARSESAPGVLLVRSRIAHPARKVDLMAQVVDSLGETLVGTFVVAGVAGVRVRRIR
jgi:predicted nuclease of predicted toxin-antitoxin system